MVAKKMGVAFGMIAFAFLCFGSLIFGARILTSLIRGFEGALIFGGIAWILGKVLVGDDTDFQTPTAAMGPEPQKGTNLDQTV